jgi:hypothetical protein
MLDQWINKAKKSGQSHIRAEHEQQHLTAQWSTDQWHQQNILRKNRL